MTTKTTEVPELTTMLEAGVHFGHERSKRHPKMNEFIFMQRNRVAIIDLEQTQVLLTKACEFLQKLAKQENSIILFVGTKRQAREIVRKWAEESNMPYVTKRWLGGTLTNFATIQKSIEKLEELKQAQNSAAWEKMTKKEKAIVRKEVERLEEVLEGIKSLKKMPQALIVAGAHDEKLAISEAKRMKIPVIGIADTNANPENIDYPIPANDDAVRSLDLIISTLAKCLN